MEITLKSLVLKNFKGIRDLTVYFDQNTKGYGDNATGKTTLFDAFLWLLFDKDSQNKKDFEIKTLDAAGKVLPGLDHEVEGTLLINGKPLTLRKVFSEKWTKKRGSATAEFTGHTTDYFVNGVPVKLKEFKERVDSIGDESIFKLLTNPTYFNEQMDWKTRRKILLEVAGDVTDDEVISSNEKLAKLPTILSGHSLDDLRKIIAARRTEINKELEKIPVRIDEAQRSKPDTSSLNESQLDQQIEQLRSDVELKEMELSRIQSGGEVSVQEKLLREVEGEMLQIKNNLQQDALEAVNVQRKTVFNIQTEINQLQYDIQTNQGRVGSNETVITAKNQERDRLRAQWAEINAETFEDSHDENCPACGQSLPAEQIQAAHDKALASFNRMKSESLERVSVRGKKLMSEVQTLEQSNAQLTAANEQKSVELKAKQSALATANEKLEKLQASIQDVSTIFEYQTKVAEREAIKEKIQSLRTSNQTNVERVRLALADLRAELRSTESKKASFAQVTSIDARIKELSEQERKLTAEYESLEEQLYMTEEFIRTKVNLLESRINSKFKYARFKLFETQINGGLAETCETLYEGVPYGSGLNNAAKINVGLDIINTLSAHYDVSAPIFIDNAEAVTKLEPTNSQIIALYVSELDKVLRFETDLVARKEAV